MFKFLNYVLLVFCCLLFFGVHAQEQHQTGNEERFLLKGVVQEKNTWKGIEQVQIASNTFEYTSTNKLGEFSILVSLNDKLTFTHPRFETISYTVKSKERITLYVVPSTKNQPESSQKQSNSYYSSISAFNKQIKLAKASLRKDALKSVDYVSEALKIALEDELDAQYIAEAYQVLGAVYFYWKQFDLAISNYQLSLQYHITLETKLALIEALLQNKNPNECLGVLKSVNKSELTARQQVSYYEYYGDVYLQQTQYTKAEQQYQNALVIANKHALLSKITDLNSKLGDLNALKGNTQNATEFYNNAMALAEKENLKRTIQETNKVADFLSENNQYEEEIQLRKRNLQRVRTLPLSDSTQQKQNTIEQDQVVSPQRLNYKIGAAYLKQKKLDEAIPYFQKSKEEANASEDLIVEKDATRKLSEIYQGKEDFVKAYEVFQDYVALVEKLYIKKEQEIVQASKFTKALINSQNRIATLEKDRELSEGKINLALRDSQLAQEQNTRQQYTIYAMLLIMLLLSLVVYYMFGAMRQQKLNNNLLALKQLRSQMNPHFIFNALNSINMFIAKNDERTANKYLSDFSMLMRSVLENSEKDFIPLSEEIDLLKLYVKLEHFRFQDKFDYQINISEKVAVNEYKIPPMLLQPYIENAIWHGLRYKTTKGLLTLKVAPVSNSKIAIEIEDDGIGRAQSYALKTKHQQKQQSKGMASTAKRLAILNQMYKGQLQVAIVDKPNASGTKVVLTLSKI